MNLGSYAFALAATALAVTAHGSAPPEPTEQTLRIMLQGSSALAMRELVTDNGGVVTHDLPIIDAVGARMTKAGLDKVLESPLVGRYLDDLSISDGPPAEPETPDSNCDVGGALQLEMGSTVIKWKLYNKKGEVAKLRRLDFTWPAKLGVLTDLKLGKLTLELPETTPGSPQNRVELEFDENSYPQFKLVTALQARFNAANQSADEPPIQQRDFSLEAHFVGDCTTKLIPGYANNHEDSYFPTAVGADSLHKHGITGKGVTVAIIDSGLWEHKALAEDTQGKNRLLARYDAITNTKNEVVFDESGHGTHMTSVLAHSDPVTQGHEPTGSYKGIAPDVSLIAVKAFNVGGQGDFLDLVRAIQFVVDNKETYDIKVLNLSFAARPRWRYWLDPINQAVMRAWASGITVVAAAGNEGPDAMTVGSPGNLPYVITVGAVTDSWTLDTRDDDYIPDFSSRGPTPDAHIKPDIVAPGGHMTGLTRPDSTLAKTHPDYFLNTGEFVMTGSSQASALVSGIAALLLQLEPELSPDDIKCKLTSSAELAINRDGLLAYSPFQQGSGYVSASRAVTLGSRGCGNVGLDIQKDIEDIDHFLGPAIVEEDGSTSLPGLSDMLSPEVPEKGDSESRRWGAKNHIERAGYKWRKQDRITESLPFDWERIYLEEKATIEGLAGKPPTK